MQRQCSWDKDDEFFAPALKRMIPILDREYKQAEEQYLEAKRRKDAIHEMFATELLMERKKKILVTNVLIIAIHRVLDFVISR